MTKKQFETSVLIHQDKMYRYAVSRLHDLDLARDAVQDVLLKLWKQKESLQKVNNLEAWCIKIMSNRCIDLHRAKKTDALNTETINMPARQNLIPENLTANQDLKNKVFELIKELPETQQEVFRLRDIMGYSNPEIEKLMLLNASQVKVNLFRARQKIRNRLTQIIDYGLTN